MPAMPVISLPTIALIFIASFQRKDPIAHQIRYTLVCLLAMIDTYTAKVLSHSDILVIIYCLDLDPTFSSKLRWFGTRSPNSMNAPDFIFCTRLNRTGGIDEPGANIEVTKHVVKCQALLWFSGSTLTWSRSKPRRSRR